MGRPNSGNHVKTSLQLLFEDNVSEVNTDCCKIFEYVKGAKVTGTSSLNETIKVSTIILTGQNRTSEYSQSTTSDLEWDSEFIVSYSIYRPISGKTQFDKALLGHIY